MRALHRIKPALQIAGFHPAPFLMSSVPLLAQDGFILSAAQKASAKQALPLCLHAQAATASTGAAPARGAFILLEGLDRSGKTTQVARLCAHLAARGVTVDPLKFPARETAIGQLINAYLTKTSDISDAAVHLLFSANRWEAAEGMRAALAAGRTLVVDRYAYSGVAYTAAKRVNGLDVAWCRAPDVGLPAPDLVVFLGLSSEAAAQRSAYGEERYERAAFQDQVQATFSLVPLRWAAWALFFALQFLKRSQAHEHISSLCACAHVFLQDHKACILRAGALRIC
jgi:dTMP kinase